jgi:hypothetical protein
VAKSASVCRGVEASCPLVKVDSAIGQSQHLAVAALTAANHLPRIIIFLPGISLNFAIGVNRDYRRHQMPTVELLELVRALASVSLGTTALNQLSRPPLFFELVALQQLLQLEPRSPPLATRALLLLHELSPPSLSFDWQHQLQLEQLSPPLDAPGLRQICTSLVSGIF